MQCACLRDLGQELTRDLDQDFSAESWPQTSPCCHPLTPTCDQRPCGSAAIPSPLPRARAPPGGRRPYAPAKMQGLFLVRAQRPSCTSGPKRHCAGRQARSPPSFGSNLRDNSPRGARPRGARARRRRCGRPQRSARWRLAYSRRSATGRGERRQRDGHSPPPHPPPPLAAAPGQTRQTPPSLPRKEIREVWTSSSVRLAQKREPAAVIRSSRSGCGCRLEESGGTRGFALARHVPCHLPSPPSTQALSPRHRVVTVAESRH